MYHFGKCSGVAESTFRSKGEAWRKAWRCPTCRHAGARGSQSGRSNTEQETDYASLFMSINDKLEQLMTLKCTVENIEQSVQTMSDQYDTILQHITRQDKDIAELRKRVDAIESREPLLDSEQIMKDINDLEWQSRKLNLEFHGISESENEDLLSKVNAVTSKVSLPALTVSDVAAVHRLPAAKDKVPAILVRFSRQSHKDLFLSKRAELNQMKTNCFMLENLTKRNKELLRDAKNWAKNNNFKYVWHRNGKIFVRQRDGANAIHVACTADLDKAA